jgi:hypothetical protein
MLPRFCDDVQGGEGSAIHAFKICSLWVEFAGSRAQMNYTRSVKGIGGIDNTKVGDRNVSHGRPIPNMVESIEEVSAEHKPRALKRHFEILPEPNVQHFLAVPEEGVTPEYSTAKIS